MFNSTTNKLHEYIGVASIWFEGGGKKLSQNNLWVIHKNTIKFKQ